MHKIFLRVFMLILWSAFFAVLVLTGRKKRLFLRGFGSEVVPLLFILCALRMLIPFFPHMSVDIRLKGIFADFYEWFILNKHSLLGRELSIGRICAVVWIVTSGVLLIRFAIHYHRDFAAMKRIAACTDDMYTRVLQEIFERCGKKFWVEVKKTEAVHTPMGAGILRKMILLPEKNYTREELYHILLHEVTHFVKHDQLWMLFMRICKCVFWWNPFFSVLYQEFLASLEIRCDLNITKVMSSHERAAYLRTVIDAVKGREDTRRFQDGGAVAFAGTYYEREVLERFYLVAKGNEDWGGNKGLRNILTGGIILAIALSFFVVIKPAYDPPSEDIYTDPGVIEVTPENAYVLKDKEGKYFMIFGDLRFELPEGEVELPEFKLAGFEIVEEE